MQGGRDRVIGPALLGNPIRRIVEPRGRVIKRIRGYVREGMRVLDVGSGPGYYTGELVKLVGPEGLVAAVDLHPGSIERLKRMGYGNLVAVTGSATDLKFEDSYFDFVFSNLVLCCVYDYRRALSEMIRVMKPGAHAYVSVSRSPANVRPGITSGEWMEILGNFSVVTSGEGLMERWAVVRRPGSSEKLNA